MRTTRRECAKGITGAVMAVTFARAGEPGRLPIAFSTLGCPAWDLQKILNFAGEHGFAAIELRGLQGNLDLPSHRPLPLDASLRRSAIFFLAVFGLPASAVSPALHSPIPRRLPKFLPAPRDSSDWLLQS